MRDASKKCEQKESNIKCKKAKGKGDMGYKTGITMVALGRTPVILAAFSQLHQWLPGSLKNHHAENFASVMRNANVCRIVFLRHGQTGLSNGVDFDRMLTDEGRSQARVAGASFGSDLKPFYSSLLVSPAPRTMETAHIFLDAADANETELKPLPVLYDGTMQPKGSPIFRKIGYAPLQDYLLHEEDAQDAQHILGDYAHSVVEALMDIVEQEGAAAESPGCTLLMVGHAIYLPAAALGVASLLGCDDDLDVILSTSTKEAEGYIVDIDDASVRYLARPSEYCSPARE
jgi:broad specificity phosphatase PhoE